ncbi:MAG: sigma-70 family RNA polymerase sigma factor [Verrucomicrobiota bacterium]
MAYSEDLAQETFATAWKNLSDLKELGKFKSWLCTIARNLCKRSVRKARRKVEAVGVDLEAVQDRAMATEQASPSEEMVSQEDASLVWGSLEQLPETYREPMILFYREEESVARVAEAMDLSEDAVKQRLSRGRKLLEDQLAGVIETTLRRTRPGHGFTAGVLVTISALKPKAAMAATGSLGAKALTASGASIGVAPLLLKIPLVAWAVRLALQNARSPEERTLVLRQLLVGATMVAVYVGLLFILPRYEHLIPSDRASAFMPGLLLLICMVPHIAFSIMIGRRIQKRRGQTGMTLHEVTASPQGFATRLACSLALVLAWMIVGPVFLQDYVVLFAIAVLALGLIAAVTHLVHRHPHREFQVFGATLAVASLAGALIFLWRSDQWTAAIEPGSSLSMWLSWANSGMLISVFILTLLAWKRSYGQAGNKNAY